MAFSPAPSMRSARMKIVPGVGGGARPRADAWSWVAFGGLEADGIVGGVSTGGTSRGAGVRFGSGNVASDVRDSAPATAPRPRAARGAQEARTRWG
jgi:hypothetical protein